mgnify:FL=1
MPGSSAPPQPDLFNFGGLSAEYEIHNDLWRFNQTAEQWIWVGGNSVDDGAIPNTQYWPGDRMGAAAWDDSMFVNGSRSDNIEVLIFGGYGHYNSSSVIQSIQDVWRLVISREQLGSVTATQLQGVGSNMPAARMFANTWSVTHGESSSRTVHWLFGGWGATKSGSYDGPCYNDFWSVQYNSTLGNVTWTEHAISGDWPSERYSAAIWQYPTDDGFKLYMFGGLVVTGDAQLSTLDDLWYLQATYTVDAGGSMVWAMKWKQLVSSSSDTGIPLKERPYPASEVRPQGRGGAITWTLATEENTAMNHYFYLFGGSTIPSGDGNVPEARNDMFVVQILCSF